MAELPPLLIEIINLLKWPLVGLAVPVAFFLIFRGSIDDLLNRLKKAKPKEGEFQFETDGGEPQEDQENLPQEPEEVEETAAESVHKEELDISQDSLLDAFASGNFDQADEIYDGLKDELDDASDIRDTKVLYHSMNAVIAEDSDSRQEIEELAESDETEYEAYYYRGLARQYLGDHDQALDRFEEALNADDASEKDRATAIGALAVSLSKKGEVQAALDRIDTAISEHDEDAALAELYAAKAQVWGERNAYARQAAALERALAANPDDDGWRFQAAYAYGAAGLPEPSVCHYMVLYNKGNRGVVENNLGVTYGQLDLKGTAMELLQNAMDEELPIAYGNFIRRLVQAGLWELAEDHIEDAKALDTVHSTTGDAVSQLEERRNEEEKQVSRAKERGNQIREIWASWTESTSLSEDLLAMLEEGEWHDGEKSFDLEFEEGDADYLAISWREDFTNFYFSGQVSGLGAIGELYKAKGESISEGDWSRAGPALAFYDRGEGDNLLLTVPGEKGSAIHSLRKIQETD